MPAIGQVTLNNKGGYSGSLRTLTIDVPIEFVPNKAKNNERAPDFHIYSGPVEVGAAWARIGKESGDPYVSAVFAAPEFGNRKLYANLGKAAGQNDDRVLALIWNPED
jgi:uncharacterized protein (DUF736 family)